jgi:hypothetical protein
MRSKFQIVIDCEKADQMAHFWAEALGYVIEPPPGGFSDWNAYWRARGLPDDEMIEGDDSIIDPEGVGPRIWFQQVDERKSVKNRLHLDLSASGGTSVPLATRRARVDTAVERLVSLGATSLGVLETPVSDHYAVSMLDPEGNEFDVN